MIHLDTSFLIRALVPGSPQDKSLRRWLESGDSFVMSTIAWTEFLCGPLETRQADLARQIVSDRIAFSEEDAIVGARLFNDSGRRRGSMFDCMIAATALHFLRRFGQWLGTGCTKGAFLHGQSFALAFTVALEREARRRTCP